MMEGSSLFPCRLLVDGPREGGLNMRIDEVLLNSGVAGVATLRFYQWSRPTVSLGHFQAALGQTVPERFAGLDVVRRLSGGGAILHDQELTYSCVLPPSHSISREPTHLYDAVHLAIIEVLKENNILSRMRGADSFADQSFLCFSRGDSRDIVIRQSKIVGSAQRRRQGAVLQHGSILLRQSPFAPEFPGIAELSERILTPEMLIPSLQNAVANRLGLRLVMAELSTAEQTSILESAT